MLALNLIASTLMIAFVVMVHFLGIAFLIWVFRKQPIEIDERADMFLKGATILGAVLGLFFLHTLEIWSYAVFYMVADQFETFEEALYFSTSTFTTVGFGDLTLDKDWRLFSAIESAAGFLLIGWSTAFLVSVTAKIRMFEAELAELAEESQSEDDT